MKYVYHLGVHKTGSTLIQNNLSLNLDALRAQGIWYVNAEMPKAISKQRKIIRQLRRPDLPDPAPDALTSVNRRIATRAARAGARLILLSEENRIGPPFHQELLWSLDRPAFYPAADQCMAYVTAGQSPENTKFVLFSRDPASYALSIYSEAVRMRQTRLDMDAFFAAIDVGSIDFAHLHKRLQSVAPEITVIMRSYEDFKSDARQFLLRVFDDLGVSPEGMDLNLDRTRSRLDRSQIHDLLEIEARTDLKPMRRRNLREAVIARAQNKDAPLRLPEWVRRQLSV